MICIYKNTLTVKTVSNDNNNGKAVNFKVFQRSYQLSLDKYLTNYCTNLFFQLNNIYRDLLLLDMENLEV